MVLDTQQQISTIFYASMVQDPFHTFHGVRTSLLLFQESIMVLNSQKRIRTIFYASTVQDPFHTSKVQKLLLFYSRSLLQCLIPNNKSAQSSILPRCRTLSTLPRCRNFSSLILGIIMVLDTPTTNQHNLLCFHGVGPFPQFHSVGTSPLFLVVYYNA